MQSPSSTSDAGFRLARCARRVFSASRFLCCSPSSLLSGPERVKMADPSVSPLEQVVQALNVLYTDPDRIAKDKANTWLADFQKSVRAALARARSGGRGTQSGVTAPSGGVERHGRPKWRSKQPSKAHTHSSSVCTDSLAPPESSSAPASPHSDPPDLDTCSRPSD